MILPLFIFAGPGPDLPKEKIEEYLELEKWIIEKVPNRLRKKVIRVAIDEFYRSL